MSHDQVVSTFWPRLYDVYPDFQLWVVDDKETIGYACTLPVRWDGMPEPRGLDWAMSNGVAGEPTTLCAVVVVVAPAYRGTGVASEILQRMSRSRGGARPRPPDRACAADVEGALSADADRAATSLWRREDGLPLRPVAPHARARSAPRSSSPAPRSMTVTGSRAEWEEWTRLQFPEDGDYVVPGALVPVRFESGRAPTSSRTSGCGIRRSPYRYGHGQAARGVDAGRAAVRGLAADRGARAPRARRRAPRRPARVASTSCARARTGCAASRGTRRSRRRWSRTSSRSTSERPARSFGPLDRERLHPALAGLRERVAEAATCERRRAFFCAFSRRRRICRFVASGATPSPCCSCMSSSARRSSRVSCDIAACAFIGSRSAPVRCIFFIALASSGFDRSSAAFDAFCIHRLRIGTFEMPRDDRPQVAAVLDAAEQREHAEQRDEPEQDPERDQERDDVRDEHRRPWY